MLCPLMRAGEKPSTIPLQDDFPGNRNLSYRKAAPITFTGNPSVDFFGLDNRLAFREPFAKMFDTLVTEEYSGEKNKWLATGLSLVLPGAGEFYTKSYVKSGIFLAVELTAFILQSRYNTRGDEQTAYFEKYSDQHYSADQYARWTVNNTSALNPALNANNYHVFVQGAPGGPPYEDINWSELNRLERDVANRTDGQFNGYTHAMPYYS